MRFMNMKFFSCAAVFLAVILSATGVIHPDHTGGMALAIVGIGMLDVFKQDAFGVIALTDAVNKLPFIPGRAGQVITWAETGVPVTSIMIEEVAGELKIINPTPRGGPGETSAKDKRTARILAIPHYQHDDAIYAEEVQGVRAFGQESVLQTVFDMVNMRLGQHVQLKLDPTLEYQRIGAIKGTILNGDGSTLYNLFTEFGVSQEAEIDFDLDNAAPASGAVRKVCTAAVRLVANNLGGIPYQGIYAFCGDAFWDDLIAHKEVRETFLNQAEASQLRGTSAFQMLDYGGIRFENYRGAVGGSAFVNTDKVHIFAVGVPGLFRTVYGPADYIETVNTLGLPRYARQYDMQNGKGVNLEVQMNGLSYCTRPKTLLLGKRT